jgi:hypothetical protein
MLSNKSVATPQASPFQHHRSVASIAAAKGRAMTRLNTRQEQGGASCMSLARTRHRGETRSERVRSSTGSVRWKEACERALEGVSSRLGQSGSV